MPVLISLMVFIIGIWLGVGIRSTQDSQQFFFELTLTGEAQTLSMSTIIPITPATTIAERRLPFISTTSLAFSSLITKIATITPTSKQLNPPTITHSPAVTSEPEPTDIPLPIRVSPRDNMEMVFIPEGGFLRGLSEDQISTIMVMCPDCNSDNLRDQIPQRLIYLDGFWIDRTEVTNRQFSKFITETGYVTTAEQRRKSYVMLRGNSDFIYIDGADWRHPSGYSSSIAEEENYPVTQVSWDDAAAYCQWAGRRLPTEAEWEKSARGRDGYIFPWGNTKPDENFLNFDLIYSGTVSVGSYPNGASPYGVLDMAGNLWEWVADFYQENYYQTSPDHNPSGPLSGEGHPLRGGSWASEYRNYLYFVTTTFRLWNKSFIRSNVIGFRCAMDE